MSPEQLAVKNTESGHQKALFAWANMARRSGFEFANDMATYSRSASEYFGRGVRCLQWLHAIPNGGARDPVTAARMKAEGVKRGIPDVFLPYPRLYDEIPMQAGLYIELKKLEVSSVSKEQSEFAFYCSEVGYRHVFAYGWRQAADYIQEYLS